MINIVHQKVTSKPPISVKIRKTPRGNKKKNNEKTEKHEDKINKINECADCSDHEKSDGLVCKKGPSDCNQNIIETESCSLDQLCDMISDLEQSLGHEVVAVETSTLPMENVAFVDVDHMIEKEDCGFSGASASTYDDIMSFLGTLEQDCPLELENPEPKELEQLKSLIQNPTNKTKDDLAVALLQLEDREATLNLLKEELKNERKAACDKFESLKKSQESALQTQKTKYQNIIRRHQKFVEQLIEEKKQLSDKCNSLATAIKDLEMKQQKESKLLMEKHTIELQRTREMCLAGEKIRRERWLELKKNKIKESTVKGLEPELRNMIDAHQKEVLEIRSAHMKELQDVELRAIRRANQQLEELRVELTASHDKILAGEKEAIRLRYQEKFEEQENLIHKQQRKFFEDLQMEKRNFKEELERRKEERDATVQLISNQSEEKIAKILKQFEVDKKELIDNLQAERDVWRETFIKQQISKFELAEARIRDECNRERDRQIELGISRIEKETREMKNNLQKNSESKLQCLREKYESDLEISRENERVLKEKLEICQEKIERLEVDSRKLESKLSKCLIDLQESRRSEEKLVDERDHAKKLARQEIEGEKKVLEMKNSELYREIEEINANRDSNLAQLYSRIRLIVTQKDVTINRLKRECDQMRSKCDHLEKLLDQQRKEFVLKTL